MPIPPSVADFLRGKRIAVSGVSRDGKAPANAIFRRLRSTGHEVCPVNPRTAEVEGVACYPNLIAVPGALDGLVVASPPAASFDLVRQCVEKGVPRIWFHRAIGAGSVSPEAVREAGNRGLACIVGGCPLMYCGAVDPFHRCMRWMLRWSGRAPG